MKWDLRGNGKKILNSSTAISVFVRDLSRNFPRKFVISGLLSLTLLARVICAISTGFKQEIGAFEKVTLRSISTGRVVNHVPTVRLSAKLNKQFSREKRAKRVKLFFDVGSRSRLKRKKQASRERESFYFVEHFFLRSLFSSL